jgi:hypothetical protein
MEPFIISRQKSSQQLYQSHFTCLIKISCIFSLGIIINIRMKIFLIISKNYYKFFIFMNESHDPLPRSLHFHPHVVANGRLICLANEEFVYLFLFYSCRFFFSNFLFFESAIIASNEIFNLFLNILWY